MKKFWMRWDYLKIGLKLNNVQAVYSKKKNRLYVNCKCSKIHDFPSMTFIIDKHLIEIPGEDLFHPVTSDNNCLKALSLP